MLSYPSKAYLTALYRQSVTVLITVNLENFRHSPHFHTFAANLIPLGLHIFFENLFLKSLTPVIAIKL